MFYYNSMFKFKNVIFLQYQTALRLNMDVFALIWQIFPNEWFSCSFPIYSLNITSVLYGWLPQTAISMGFPIPLTHTAR